MRPSPSSAAGQPVARKPALLGTPLIAISATAFAVEIPFFFFGLPSGHDVEFHLYSWLEVLTQWKQGIFYPRWAALAHFAYGEPRFVFYPPASWMLGAALSSIFPWTVVASIYIWLVLVAAGASMFFLARRWLSRRDAIFAACLYAASPYHLVIVYWRSAFAELLASALIPLLLLLILRAREDRQQAIVPLAIVLAAAWLINAPAAVMIHYSLVFLLIVFAWQDRSPRLLLAGAVSVALGACLAASYLLPAIYEQKWVNIAESVSAGSRPQDNFLFIHTTDAEHDAFNRIISWVATTEIVLMIAAFGAGKLWRDERRAIWNTLAGWAILCSVVMFSVSSVLWNFLPKLRFMQFPWRWSLCLSLVLAVFVAVGIRRWWGRLVVCLAMAVVIGFAWQHIQPPWWDNAGDLREMQDNVESGAGYEGADEYTPVGGDPAAIDKDARRVTVDGPQHTTIHVYRWDAREKVFTADMSGRANLLLRLFNYPAWQLEVNGRTVQAATREGTGQLLVPVEAGVNRVLITFTRTWDRIAGAWLSLAAWFCLITWSVLLQKRRGEARHAAQSP